MDAEDLATFADFFGPDTTTVLPSSASTGTAPPALADVDGHRVLIHDSSASAALSRAISESDAAPRSSALADAIAHIALAETPGTVLLALERDEGRTVDALRDAMDALEELATPVTLAELLAEDPAPTDIDTVDDPARADALREMLADEQDLLAFSSILEDPAVLTDLERIRLLQVIGVGEPEGGFVAAVAAHRERTAAILSSVGIQPSSDVQILSAAVDLPVWVHNELPWPITVTLGARPADPRLEVQAQTTVESIPMNNTRVRVPVQARVGSGEVDVHLHLTSPTGVPIGEPQVTHVIVRAEWESIGLVVLGVGVGLLLVLGVIRTVRRRRKADAAASASGTSGDDDE
ncbi:DUF6049 family protein [Microbacterium sp. NIBRBAC000506063]|uniref:DUF6049 family protein n=1 Tax=Microbacterium sp. NIBRBAC000506063 TaxID=2734618 RepID=UPI001BB7BEA5|nr:DUF6049 family protein [Microbacterium sp. NIBRBAC000506063]QTV80441.1 hypothetical protein KAE78_05860 [Microbacterium sp. NIBRBAC000506063]